jgi:hypothetical protein
VPLVQLEVEFDVTRSEMPVREGSSNLNTEHVNVRPLYAFFGEGERLPADVCYPRPGCESILWRDCAKRVGGRKFGSELVSSTIHD